MHVWNSIEADTRKRERYETKALKIVGGLVELFIK